MASEKPIVKNSYILQKYPGKGGWTYALLHDSIKIDGKFRQMKVRGTIDGVGIKGYTLFPIPGQGHFLPVKAEIRKKIKKGVGDKVKVVLYKDESKFVVPAEFISCLKDAPEAYTFFKQLSDSEKRLYVLWIYSAKRIETKTDRIVKSIDRLTRELKLYDKTTE